MKKLYISKIILVPTSILYNSPLPVLVRKQFHDVSGGLASDPRPKGSVLGARWQPE